MKPSAYLEVFFDEKCLPFVQWEIADAAGMTHFISNEVVIEHIKAASLDEQAQIADVLRRIDFANGDVNHFLRHLAGAIVGAPVAA